MKEIIITSQKELDFLLESTLRRVLNEERESRDSSNHQTKNEIVFLDEAIQITGLAKQTLYTKTSRNEIPHYKRGRKLYFKRSELLFWIEEGKQI